MRRYLVLLAALASTYSDAAEPIDPCAKPKPTIAWHAVDSGTLAYGTTGYVIRFSKQRGEEPYSAFDPEGRMIGMPTTVLQYLKQEVERSYQDRTEFEGTPEQSGTTL